MDYEAQVCSRCGNLISVCSDPDANWHPDLTTCWPSAAVEWAWRRLRRMNPPVNEDDVEGQNALHPLDGVRVFVSQQKPQDDPFA